MTPGAGAADPRGVGERVGERLAAGVLMHRHQRRHAAARLVLAPHQVAGRLGRHHRDVHAGGRHDLAVVDVEPVGEHQRLARARGPGATPRLVDGAAVLVRHQHHDDVGRAPPPRPPGARRAPRPCARSHGRAARPQADDDLGAALAQVEGVGVPLAAVADDGEGAAGEPAAVGVGIVVHPHWCVRHVTVSELKVVRRAAARWCRCGPPRPPRSARARGGRRGRRPRSR